MTKYVPDYSGYTLLKGDAGECLVLTGRRWIPRDLHLGISTVGLLCEHSDLSYVSLELAWRGGQEGWPDLVEGTPDDFAPMIVWQREQNA